MFFTKKAKALLCAMRQKKSREAEKDNDCCSRFHRSLYHCNFTALFLLPINIAYEPVKINFPFEVEDVENVEMYHYDGVPASAEKKVVVAENDIKTLYDKFKGLSLKRQNDWRKLPEQM